MTKTLEGLWNETWINILNLFSRNYSGSFPRNVKKGIVEGQLSELLNSSINGKKVLIKQNIIQEIALTGNYGETVYLFLYTHPLNETTKSDLLILIKQNGTLIVKAADKSWYSYNRNII